MSKLAELKALLEGAKDDAEVKGYLAELSKPTADSVAAFLETEDGKKVMQPRIDQSVTKAIETFKANHSAKLEEEIKAKLNPPKTEAEKRVAELEKQFAEEKAGRAREALKNKALTEITTRKLPASIVDMVIAENEEATLARIETVQKAFGEEYLKGIGRVPHQNTTDTAIKKLEDMSMDQYVKERKKM